MKKYLKIFSAFIDLEEVAAFYRAGDKLIARLKCGDIIPLFEGADTEDAFVHLALTLDNFDLVELPEGEELTE